MEKHPIENIMSTTMENIRDMVDVNTVIGEPITTQDGSTVIPISRVSFGFVAGGGEYRCPVSPKALDAACERMPFAGGTGAGVTIQPMGFLVTSDSSVRLLPAQPYAPADRIIELAPQLMCELRNFLRAKNESKEKQPAHIPAPVQP
jgi:sporulation protein YtfJ